LASTFLADEDSVSHGSCVILTGRSSPFLADFGPVERLWAQLAGRPARAPREVKHSAKNQVRRERREGRKGAMPVVECAAA
jgi:hypothetical protein